MAEDREVYYCAKCRRQQQPSQGTRCIMCNRITVSWFISGSRAEPESVAIERWESINGKVKDS
jgi:hypothetical protein